MVPLFSWVLQSPSWHSTLQLCTAVARPHSAAALVAKTVALLTTGAQTITITRGGILLHRDINIMEHDVMIEVPETWHQIILSKYSSVFQVSGRASMMSLVSLPQRLPPSPTPSPAARTRPEARHARPDQYPYMGSHTRDSFRHQPSKPRPF